MLEQLQKHKTWILWIILVLIIISFLFFGIFPSMSGRGEAAVVNGEVITSTELDRAYRNLYETYRQIFKDQMNDGMARNLRQQALRELVQDKLLVQEAERIGLRVPDDELRAAIMQAPTFAPAGRFDKAAYDRYLDYINVKPSAFEEMQRNFMLRKKIERVIEDGVVVTDDEVRAAYAARNPKAKAGEFEKGQAAFRQSYLAEKKRDAITAVVQELFKKGKITMNKAELGF